MDANDIRDAMKGVAESVRENAAVRRRKNVSYALVAKAGYDEIQKLRKDGYSYDVICEALVSKGILGEGAAPKILSMAFLREEKRRNKREQERAEGGKEEKREEKPSVKPARDGGEQKGSKEREAAHKPKEDSEDRLKDLTSSVVDTGTGQIRKLPNGSFEF